jgi:tetratricopeptide (TPR) repeat protein
VKTKVFRVVTLALLLVPAVALGKATEKDAAALGRSVAQAFNQRSVGAFMKLVDVDAFGHIVLDDLDLGAADRAGIRRRLPASVRKMAETSMRAIGQNEGSAKYLRAGLEDGRAYALVRLDLGDQGVDYIKYYASSPRAVEDWYIFTAASLYSGAVRFNLASIFRSESTLLKLFRIPQVSARDTRAFIEVRDSLVKQDYAGAYKALEKFPEDYRNSRQWALMRVTYGGRAGDDVYRSALRHLASRFGADADLQLLLIDHYFYENRFERALAAVAALERAVGGEDASTNGLRGNLLTALKRSRDAEAACRRGIALEADFKPAYWCLVSVALERNDGRLAVEALTAYEKAFGVSFDVARLAQQEGYERIGKTREFAAWARAHK